VPGLQALLGFQFAVVITHSFDKLPVTSKAAHAVALGLIALSTILLMAPAAHRRIVYGEASLEFLALANRFLMAATVTLALGFRRRLCRHCQDRRLSSTPASVPP
jgi:Family of unknown function (DUF6328)